MNRDEDLILNPLGQFTETKNLLKHESLVVVVDAFLNVTAREMMEVFTRSLSMSKICFSSQFYQK